MKTRLLIAAFGCVVLICGRVEADSVFTVDANLNSVFDSYFSDQVTPPYHPTFVDTGLVLEIGDILSIDATGLWRISPSDPWTDADGQAGRFASGVLISSLVGQISSDGPRIISHGNPQPIFFIGSSFSQVVTQTGTLYLGFNDTDYGNNEGYVTATVDVTPIQPVPLPATVVLVGIGLAGISGRKLFKR